MKRSRAEGRVRRFLLPVWVGRETLDLMVDLLRKCSPKETIVLDFARTAHIDFRALRCLGKKLREMEHLKLPLQLTGLRPYCLEIFRFALEAPDWDLFEDWKGEESLDHEAGNLPVRVRFAGQDGWRRGDSDPLRFLPTPHPN